MSYVGGLLKTVCLVVFRGILLKVDFSGRLICSSELMTISCQYTRTRLEKVEPSPKSRSYSLVM